MECETKQSACIFNALADGGNSLPKSQAFTDIRYAIESQMNIHGKKLDATAHEFTDALMGGRSAISRGEFRGVYDAFRAKQLGCEANGEWASGEDMHWIKGGYCVEYTNVPNQQFAQGIHQWAMKNLDTTASDGSCDHIEFHQMIGHKQFTTHGFTLDYTVWAK
tara:strand:- start:106 stop:597 length:492 start_codon:yes stop_codon:yes gene_type:complete